MDSSFKTSATSDKRRHESQWNRLPRAPHTTGTEDHEAIRDESFDDSADNRGRSVDGNGQDESVRTPLKRTAEDGYARDGSASKPLKKRKTEKGNHRDDSVSKPVAKRKLEEGNDRDDSVSKPLKKRKTEEGNDRDDSVSKPLKKRKSKTGIDGHERLHISSEERRRNSSVETRKRDDVHNPEESLCDIPEGGRTEGGNYPDAGNELRASSGKVSIRPSEENENASGENDDKTYSVRGWSNVVEQGDVSPEHSNELNNDSPVNETNLDDPETSAEKFDAQENLTDIRLGKLVRKRRKLQEYTVDMSSVDGLWARSLKGPHLVKTLEIYNE